MEGNQGRLELLLPREVGESSQGLTGLLGPAFRASHRAQAGEHEAPEAPRPLPAAAELVQGIPGEHEPGPAWGEPGRCPSSAGLAVQPTWGRRSAGEDIIPRSLGTEGYPECMRWVLTFYDNIRIVLQGPLLRDEAPCLFPALQPGP